MDGQRRRRLTELQEMFHITEEHGSEPTWAVLSETLADYLNRKYCRQVVVARERKR